MGWLAWVRWGFINLTELPHPRPTPRPSAQPIEGWDRLAKREIKDAMPGQRTKPTTYLGHGPGRLWYSQLKPKSIRIPSHMLPQELSKCSYGCKLNYRI